MNALFRDSVRPLMGCSPSAGKEELVVHVCKGGDSAGRLVDQLYSKREQRAISLTYGWDDGSGRVIKPLADLFAKAKYVHVLADMSPYGLGALQNVVDLLDRVGARWRHVGITDVWFGAVPAATRESWIESRCFPLPEEMRGLSPRRVARLASADRVGSRCRAIIRTGLVLELEAFLHPEYRAGLRRVLRRTGALAAQSR
ncbi:MAG: hypothetical protein H7Y88_11235 [Phycisphaerales bacterium]|nr:hypothetical protein [Phycisphaerales bacterium]